MKKPEYFYALLICLCISTLGLFGQNSNKAFKLGGKSTQTIVIDQSFFENQTITIPFENSVNKIYGLAATMDITLSDNDNSSVNLILIDNNFNEYLIYESHSLIQTELSVSTDTLCEETCILDGVKANSIRIEVDDASITLNSITYLTRSELGGDLAKWRKARKQEQNAYKIEKINKNLKGKGKHWVAGPTGISELSYADKKKLYGQSDFPPGFEYYAGGIISTEATSTSSTLKSATAASPYVDEWDWRNRHGKNWITPVTNQGACGSCWSFAATGATEAMVNVFYNQILNLDLSEQEILSCSGGGTCDGGYPSMALDYIKTNGVGDEINFPYNGQNQDCENKGTNTSNLIKISGRLNFGYSEFPPEEDILKNLLISKGPLSSGLKDWSHAIVLVGYKEVKENDTFFIRDINRSRYWLTIESGDPLIGKTIWIFKNSWGENFGDNGYVYVETSISNIGWTHALKTPITSHVQDYEVICEDRDGDGYYWWGIGEKPANCPECPDLADGDDSDPSKGPLDEYGYCMSLAPVASPVANFNAAPTEIDEGDAVSFSDLSTNNPTSWQWTFEGGNPSASTVKNPTVQFDNPGNYSVSLEVTNASGSDTKSVTGFIIVNEIPTPPIAYFTADNTSVKSGSTINFTDISSNNPTSWNWTFEGGNPSASTQQNPSVTFENAGKYSVTLRAANADGDNTKTVTDFITVIAPTPPTANFTANQTSINEGGTIQFTDLSDNYPDTWYWEFPGGSPANSTEQNPNISYSTVGSYDVSLTVTNTDGTDSHTMNAYITVSEEQVQVNAPVAHYAVSLSSIEVGQTVTFTDQSSNTPTSWAWTFEGGVPATSTTPTQTVTYSAAGTYSVLLNVGNEGGSDTKSTQITVTEPIAPPVANFSSDKTKIKEGEAVTFSDLSSSNPASWKWDFEGGTPSTSNERNPKVSYSNANSYKVSLTVSNAGGKNTKVIENYILVENASPEYCSNTGSATNEWISGVQIDDKVNTSGKVGYEDYTGVVFNLDIGQTHTIKLSPGFKSRSRFEYWGVWIDFNQDMVFSDSEKVFGSSKSKSSVSGTIQIPDYIGEKETRMRVVMSSGTPAACGGITGETEDYSVQLMKPQPKAPVADFAANVYTIYAGESVQFSDLSTNNPESWAWSFTGASTNSSGAQNPEIIYNTPGIYNVTLTATNSVGSSTETKGALITVKEIGEITYCIPSNIDSRVNYIREVVIGNGFNHTSAGDSYSASDKTINLSAGESYSVELYPSGNRSRNFWRIWIDFNQDGDFEDADELVLTQNNKKGSVISSISVPSYANGTTKMRISMKTGKSPSSCDTNFEGEVEDYMVSFGGASQKGQMASSQSPFDEFEENELTLYPNPTKQMINIKLSQIGENDSFALYDSVGLKIKEKYILSSFSQIDMSEYPSGMYFIVVVNEQYTFKEKIIKL